MGGGYYDRDVSTSNSSTGYDYSSYSDDSSRAMGKTSFDSALSPNRSLVCKAANPVVVAIDVTGSMGNWSKVIWDKMPMFFGQIMIQGYLEDPAISFAAIGDAFSDTAPLQVCDFEKGTALDGWLEKIWLESGGGGGSRESYELAAWYYLNCVDLGSPTKKPILFLTGDEGFYDEVKSDQISRYLGKKASTESSEEIFQKLRQKYHIFGVRKRYFTEQNRRIQEQWEKAMGPENVFILQDPKEVVDVMLGAIALVSGARDLDGYVKDMKDRDQSDERVRTVTTTLGRLSSSTSIAKRVDTEGLPAKKGSSKKKSGMKRL